MKARIATSLVLSCALASSAWGQGPPPDNDECWEAYLFHEGDSIAFDTSNATTSVFGTACGVVNNDKWFLFHGPCDGTATLSVCDNADFDTRIAVYSGDCNDLVELGCNDDAPGCSGGTSEVTVPVQTGHDYYVSVGSAGVIGGGTGTLKLVAEPTPAAKAVRFGSTNNPRSYSSNVAAIGTTFLGTVDLTTSGHAAALLVGYLDGLTFALPGGQVLLVDITHSAGELFGYGAQPGPTATFQTPIPNDLSLVETTFSSQAVHFGAVFPFALSNALDFTVGHDCGL